MLEYEEFKRRLPVAARLNAHNQVATEVSSSLKWRRIATKTTASASLSSASRHQNDVTVLGSPRREDDGSITIAPPPVTDTVDEERFEFRILRGHTIENLIKHRQGSLQVYFGLACMGLFTVMCGEEIIRDWLVVGYV